MEPGLTTELALWVAQANLNASQLMTRNPNLSDFIVLLYVITFLVNKKGRFIAAFLLCEVFGNSYNYTSAGGYEIFLGYTFIYCLLYWSLVVDKSKLKTQLACAIMIVFEARMVLDAAYNSDVESFIYTNYESITLLIHVYIISTLFPWARIRAGMDCYFRVICRLLYRSDAIAYICYNYKILTFKAAKA